MFRVYVLGVVLVAGCFDKPPDVEFDAGPPDASVAAPDSAPDASPPCVPDSIACDDDLGIYVDCDPNGAVEQAIVCPLGCSTTAEKCLDVDPSNGLASYLDAAADGPTLHFTGASTINARPRTATP